METLTTITSLFLLVGLALSPIFILRRLDKLKVKYKFIAYLTTGIVTTVFITLVFAWLTDVSDKMLLTHYGYNIDGMNEIEFYRQVFPENMERVKSLEKSVMGIGWPIKATMTYVIYFPYFLTVYLISYIIQKNKKKNYA
ncbi:hypothetical protein [Mucilaginibacter arboris]|uniref:Uncharacterized protein n=1 Tax=Mucilaginibacter arboris TaxID=2682090 RepID=A0A7K1T1X1_9SPHI|nr:hypothetical protein [Mucilaginibacter arboris]MVN23467.1 hypothetical protein [Mucilaginibacter arboris]MVN23555.1 hypothetical protein [Mucilaginibacter arboris]